MKGLVFIRLTLVFAILLVALIGVGLGLAIAVTGNLENTENYKLINPALPTKIYDSSGIMITEFSADEKRELITLNELPRHLILAALAREDPNFYNHPGFSLRAIARAAVGYLTGNRMGGGSTITQQVAGTLYTDRKEKTIGRKLKELWWALQMERRYTKNEILEIYLNQMNMGPGTYGVEATSKYFFNHSARELSLAESAVLVVLLSGPTRFNPILEPNLAMDRQRVVLDKMVELGYTTREEADASFREYWDSFDYTKIGASSYFNRDDKAPWVSEYVRRELERLLYGEMDYYRDGYSVITTMDLGFQALAEAEMAEGIAKANANYRTSSGYGTARAERVYVPLVNMLTLVFNMEGLNNVTEFQNEIKATNKYSQKLNPTVDLLSLVFDIPEIKPMTAESYKRLKSVTEQSSVEGALVVLENGTGHIKAMVGGSQYSDTNQLIRATQAKVMPGSSFKPLYYSAAIDSRQFTMATLIYDAPIMFIAASGEPYVPNNYMGSWRGPVLLYEALGLSLNIPALKVLDKIGFDAAIDRAAALLGITEPSEKTKTFPRVYPLGLGIIAVSPLSMARAFSIFANDGKLAIPFAIQKVEDRDGKIIINNEQDIREKEKKMGTGIQVITQQNAYMMTRLLGKVIEVGTLAGQGYKFNVKDDKGAVYRIPAGGKTGTSQNWSDAWTVGFTPYYTIAIWFGFDKGGNSLGMNVNGENLPAPIWGSLMNNFNQGLPRKEFPRPTGIADGAVCRESGLMPRAACPTVVSLHFLAGTYPTEYCDRHGVPIDSMPIGIQTLGGGSRSSPDSIQQLEVPDNLKWLFEKNPKSNAIETEPEIPSGYDPLTE
jgi:penicillin-binding protein 1A